MDDETESRGKGQLTSRAPGKADLVKLCRELNRNGAEYLIIGGFAIIQAGYPRTTGDIDILLETSLENDAPDLAFLRRWFGENGLPIPKD